ncbi:MAG: primosomal protein N' [Bacteroidia bacterium]|nr:MAG: primosomal protein N' [Bacteroidia bacterium]
MACYIDVILPLSVSNFYTYFVPDDYEQDIGIGKRVVVQFGSKKFYSAIISNIHHNPPGEYKAKPIEYVLDERPCVRSYQIDFWKWLSNYYLCRIGDVMNAALPAGLKLESVSNIQINKDLVLDKDTYDTLNEKEKKVLEILIHQTKVKIQDLEKIIPKSSVPKVIKSLSEKKVLFFSEELEEKYKPKLVSYLELNPDLNQEHQLQPIIQKLEKRAFKQLEGLLAFLQIKKLQGKVKKSILVERCGASAVKALLDKNILIEFLVEESRLNIEENIKTDKTLTNVQKQVLESIFEHWKQKQTCVLYGEVGSGKTEIYIELIKDKISQGKQTLYLVPEIALTTQLIDRLKKVLGNKVYVYHSKFSENERTEVWNKLLSFNEEVVHTEKSEKCAQIIIGPRSALFLPFQNLGLIIIDEEHDSSFKQRQKHPFYNARDAAIYLAHLLNAKVLLGSATPSVETLYNCSNGKYGKVVLKEKYGKAKTTRRLIDIRKYYHQIQHQTLLTPPLFDAIQDRLRKKEQVLLFHNRRGYVPITQCLQCGWVAKCQNCDVSVVYHKQHNVLLCHYCGQMMDIIQQCPACSSTHIYSKGWGIEKIEEELQRMFPDYVIARMDQDTTRSKYAHKNIIEAFEQQKIDILVGTQMITKGLDFGNVTLVGVLYADGLLHFPDFRAFERSFQLLYQLSGRTGRLEKDGEVIVQTFEPDNPVLQLFLENDYDKLYETVLEERKRYSYTPFSRVVEITLRSKDEELCAKASHQLYLFLYPYFKQYLLGPIKPYISKINNRYLQHLLIKVPLNHSYSAAKQIIKQNIKKIVNSKVEIDVIVDV